MRKMRASLTAPCSSSLRLTTESESPRSTRRQTASASGPGPVYSCRPQASNPAAATSTTMKRVSALEATERHITR